jgi:hypothetical protein
MAPCGTPDRRNLPPLHALPRARNNQKVPVTQSANKMSAAFSGQACQRRQVEQVKHYGKPTQRRQRHFVRRSWLAILMMRPGIPVMQGSVMNAGARRPG